MYTQSLSQDDACTYIALSENLPYDSIKLYINVVHILHQEAGFLNHFHNCWHVDMLLKAVMKALGVSVMHKLPITSDILRKMFTLIDFSSPMDVTFWAACLVALFSFSPQVKRSS